MQTVETTPDSNELMQSRAMMLAGGLLVLGPALALLAGVSTPISAKGLWFVSALGFSLIVAGYFLSENARRYGLVAATMMLGNGAQLWLTQPLWFPALRLKPENGADVLMAALIGLQGVVALHVLWRNGSLQRAGRLVQALGAGRLLIFLLLSTAFSVSIMGYLPRGYMMSWAFHLVAAAIVIGINLLSIAALLALPPPFTKVRGFHPVIPAAIVFAASAGLAWFAFERLPHVEDEVAYLFQARSIAGGSFSVPAPPEAAQPALDYYLLSFRNDRWFATTPPGWPATLAIGVWLGAPWLVNPALAALAVLFAHGVARRLGGPARAEIVILLMATSPWLIGAAGSLMPHMVAITLTLASWFLLLVGAASARRAAALAFLAGLAMGWVFATRQLEGVLLGTLTGMWLLSRWKEPFGMVRTCFYSLGAIMAGAYYFIHNQLLTGRLLRSPLGDYLSDAWDQGANAYGFGDAIGPPGGWGDLDIAPGHSPFEGLINTLHNLSALHLEMLGWGVGSLALVWAMLLWGRFRRSDGAMAVVAIVIVGALFFYWFSGSFYIGPRYWFSLFFPLLFLSASGYLALSERLKTIGVHGYSSGITLFVVALTGLLVFTPWRGVEKYHEFGNTRSDIRDAMETGRFGNRLVFVSGDVDPGAYLFLNDPWLPDDKPIFLRDLGEETNASVAAAFADRETDYFKVESD